MWIEHQLRIRVSINLCGSLRMQVLRRSSGGFDTVLGWFVTSSGSSVWK